MHNARGGGINGYIQTAWVCYGDGECVMVDYMFVSLPYYDQMYGTTMCDSFII
jgi:hypothetical protein